jgi:hypothetical protein
MFTARNKMVAGGELQPLLEIHGIRKHASKTGQFNTDLMLDATPLGSAPVRV